MELAERVGGEIVSVDSMQVYRGMDIGTAKPTAAERRRVPHHLIDLVDPGDSYTVAEFQEAGRQALDDMESRGVPAVICGGSGLHFRALVDPLDFPPSDPDVRITLESVSHSDLVAELLKADPEAGATTDLANPRRVLRAVEIHRLTGATPTERASSRLATQVREYEAARPFIALGLDPGDGLKARVLARLDAMLAAGWLEEVERLGPSLSTTAGLAVGYRELLEVVRGGTRLDEARSAISRSTMALAKRQRTYFRRDPRIRWLPWHDHRDRRAAEAASALEEADAWSS
jgi:tRNA dimethylallyltransferase